MVDTEYRTDTQGPFPKHNGESGDAEATDQGHSHSLLISRSQGREERVMDNFRFLGENRLQRGREHSVSRFTASPNPKL